LNFNNVQIEEIDEKEDINIDKMNSKEPKKYSSYGFSFLE
jgi:hypothetical protein